MMTFLIVVLAVFAYFVMAGAVGRAVMLKSIAKCTVPACETKCDHVEGATWCGVAWPITLPTKVGFAIAERTAVPKDTRDATRHASEIKEAEHKVQLASLRAKEVKLLEQEAGVR